MAIVMISANEYQAEMNGRTYRAERREAIGDWCVTSWATGSPASRVFWGCKVFPSLAAVAEHYKAFRGLDMLAAA